MKQACALALVALLGTTAHAAPLIYESFSYDPAANGPTGATVAPPSEPDRTGFFSITGLQPDKASDTWSTASSSNRRDQGAILSGSHAMPAGMPAAIGNSYQFGGTGETPRIDFGQSFTTGVTYYSMMVQVDTLGTSANTQISGFNTTTGTASVTQVIADLVAKAGATAGTYKLGIGKNAASANFVFDESTEYALNGAPLFIVAAFDFGAAGGQDGVAKLWINPDQASFGAAENAIPAPTLTAGAAVNDVSSLQSLVLWQYQASSPSGGLVQIDELRVDRTWEHVTPEPASIGLLALGGTALLRRRAMK